MNVLQLNEGRFPGPDLDYSGLAELIKKHWRDLTEEALVHS
jgi:hypothetical protein